MRRGTTATTVRTIPPSTLASSPNPSAAFIHPRRRETPDAIASMAIVAPHCQGPGKASRSLEPTQPTPCRIHHTNETAALIPASAKPQRALALYRDSTPAVTAVFPFQAWAHASPQSVSVSLPPTHAPTVGVNHTAVIIGIRRASPESRSGTRGNQYHSLSTHGWTSG